MTLTLPSSGDPLSAAGIIAACAVQIGIDVEELLEPSPSFGDLSFHESRHHSSDATHHPSSHSLGPHNAPRLSLPRWRSNYDSDRFTSLGPQQYHDDMALLPSRDLDHGTRGQRIDTTSWVLGNIESQFSQIATRRPGGGERLVVGWELDDAQEHHFEDKKRDSSMLKNGLEIEAAVNS